MCFSPRFGGNKADVMAAAACAGVCPIRAPWWCWHKDVSVRDPRGVPVRPSRGPLGAGVCLCACPVNTLLIKANCPQEQCLSTERVAVTESVLFSRGGDGCGGKRQKFLQIMVLCKCIKRIIPYKKESREAMYLRSPGDCIPDEPPLLVWRRF